MKLAVLLAVLSFVAFGEALKCYTCEDEGFSITDHMIIKGGSTTPCGDFKGDLKKFEKDCGADAKTCGRVNDKKNKLQLRGCATQTKSECSDEKCYCTGDLCNGSGRGWPSAGLLLAALAAALVGGR